MAETAARSNSETQVERTEPVRTGSGGMARKLLRAVAFGLVGLLVFVALALVAINTGPGRKFVADQISGMEFANGMKIGAESIEGSLYSEMTIRGITLSDPQGVFFRAPVVEVDWRPFDYLNNHVHVRSLAAPTARLLRLPEFRETPPSDGPLLPDLDITIGRLDIDRLIVEAPVTGERRVGAIDGQARIADGRAQVKLEAALIGGEGRAGGDRVALNLDAVPEDNALALDLFLSAPGNGVLAQMAGLTQSLAVRISGDGDWMKWNGRLQADLGGAPIARLGLAARDGTFTLAGETRVAKLVEGPAAALLGPVTRIALQSRWEERLGDIRGRLSSDAFTLAAQGGIDLGESRFDSLMLDFALLRPAVLAPDLAGRDIRALVTLDGSMQRPDVDYRLSAGRLAFGDTGVLGLDARGSARFRDTYVQVPVSARARAITGLDTVAGGTLTNVRLDGDLAVDWPRIMSENLRLRSDRIDAEAIIVADVSTGLYSGALDGRIDNYRVESVGIFNIQTDADLRSTSAGLSLVGSVRARSTALFNDSVRDFLGGNFTASSNVVYGPDGVIRFSRLRLQAPELRITGGQGSYAPDGRIAIQASGVSSRYGEVEVRIGGTASNPDVDLSVSDPDLGLGLSNVRAQVRSSGGGYAILARGDSDYGPFSADVVVQAGGGPLTVDIRAASIAGIDVSGRIRQAAAGPFLGRLDARGRGLAGVVRLDAEGQYQEVLVNLRGRNANLPAPAGITVGAAIIDARIILYDRPEVVADVQLADTSIGGTSISALRAVVDYRGGAGSARLLAEGTRPVPFRIGANAQLQPDLWRAALQGRLNGIDFRTASPARIVPGDDGYELLPTRLAFDRGSMRLAGRYGDVLRLQSRIDSVDLALVDSFAPGLGVGGRATGAIEFVQEGGGFPNADIRLAVRNFTRTTAGSVSQPININLLASLDAQRADLRAVMRTRGTVVGRIQATADPLGRGIAWTERIAQAPLAGGIRYLGPADALFSFAGLSDQNLRGPIAVAADFRCRVSDPCLTGIVRGRNLTYENLVYGTRLTDMVLTGRFSGERLEVQQLRAQAGDGTVTGTGFISLAADRGYPAQFDLRLDNARLASSDDLRVVASGNVDLDKPANQQPVLRGRIRLPSTRYRIVREGTAEVPRLTGVRFKPPRGRPRITGDSEASPPTGFGDVALDLDIIAPNELFVSGMGLESEWSANLDLGGTGSNPRISGTVDLIRGTLGFAGRSFELTQGRIRFLGGGADRATISINAQETIEDVEVTIVISGSVTDPQISFSSSPGLPQDEILARILFGNSVGNLSTVQAVQLAASLNALRGSGGGLNPIGKLRSATGFDRLRVLGPDDTSGRGAALSAGKYITDNIYLEVVTDARGFTATQLEIALTPSLSVLSQAGGSDTNNVSVRYRKTY